MLTFGAQKSRPSKIVGVPGALGLGVLDPAFDADGRGHLVNARRVERRGKADGFRKFGGAVHRDAMK